MDERRVAAAGDIALLISRGELPAAARALRNELLGRPDRPDMMNLLVRLLETALRTARSPFAPDPPPAGIGEDLYLRGFAVSRRWAMANSMRRMVPSAPGSPSVRPTARVGSLSR